MKEIALNVTHHSIGYGKKLVVFAIAKLDIIIIICLLALYAKLDAKIALINMNAINVM